jgi:hypothetical protein
MKTILTKPIVKKYGTFLSVILTKKSSPGDGIHGNGVKGE